MSGVAIFLVFFITGLISGYQKSAARHDEQVKPQEVYVEQKDADIQSK